jgi:hypothetical protein
VAAVAADVAGAVLVVPVAEAAAAERLVSVAPGARVAEVLAAQLPRHLVDRAVPAADVPRAPWRPLPRARVVVAVDAQAAVALRARADVVVEAAPHRFRPVA